MLFAIIISAIALLLSVALHLFNISVVADKFVGKLSKVWTKTQAVVFIAICSQLLLAVIFALAYACLLYTSPSPRD